MNLTDFPLSLPGNRSRNLRRQRSKSHETDQIRQWRRLSRIEERGGPGFGGSGNGGGPEDTRFEIAIAQILDDREQGAQDVPLGGAGIEAGALGRLDANQGPVVVDDIVVVIRKTAAGAPVEPWSIMQADYSQLIGERKAGQTQLDFGGGLNWVVKDSITITIDRGLAPAPDGVIVGRPVEGLLQSSLSDGFGSGVEPDILEFDP